MSSIFIRIFDIVASVCLGAVALPVLVVLAVAVRMTTPGPAIFRQVRVGRNEKPFVCLKLRTMTQNAPSVATHEIAVSHITSLGIGLRRSKLDELPQLWNVLVGEMSLVGPRPGLPTQGELIAARSALGVFAVRPGVTGPAQVNEVDMSTPGRLAELDSTWSSRPTVVKYFTYIAMTALGRGQGDRVRETL